MRAGQLSARRFSCLPPTLGTQLASSFFNNCYGSIDLADFMQVSASSAIFTRASFVLNVGPFPCAAHRSFLTIRAGLPAFRRSWPCNAAGLPVVTDIGAIGKRL
jgi:hypothetical protein